MANWKFYTYVHRRADTGEVFYIGKGSGKRFSATQDRSTYWKRIVSKYGVLIEVVAYFFDEEHAFQHERELIAEYRTKGVRLVNMSDGGEGPSGAVRSTETRQKISEAKTGVKRKPFSDEARANMSSGHIGLKQSPEAIAKTAAFHVGRKRSPETLARMSESLKGKALGRQVSAETREKISAAHNGRVHTKSAKQNMSRGHSNRTKYCVMSDEHKQKILAGQAAYWARRRAEKQANSQAD